MFPFDCQLNINWVSNEMASNPQVLVRLRPVVVAYLDELERIGGYGKGRAGVIRRFVENGIAREIRRNVLEKKNAADLGESTDDSD
jgi:hypothetical protein